jgi:chemotaxis protein MotB
MADDKPIIIVKKKGGHGGHHGGAWKVAYADFVTAMMAFFMVMWLVNSAETNTKQNIASYFRKPGLFTSGSGTPILIGEAGILPDAHMPPHQTRDKVKGKEEEPKIPDKKSKKELDTEGSPAEQPVQLEENKGPNTPEEAKLHALQKMMLEQKKKEERKELEKLAEEIKSEMRKIPDLKDQLGELEIKIESDGLVIEIMDTEKSSMFALSSAQITPEAQTAFFKIADLLSKYPNKLDVIGHTDSKPFSSRKNGYSNWELSADRANAARRVLLSAGITEKRLLSVVGRADRDLKDPKNPLATANRRITLKMRFNTDETVNVKDIPDSLDEFKYFEELNKAENNEVKEAKVIETKPKETATPDPYAGKDYLPWVQTKRYNKKADTDRENSVKLPEDKEGIQTTPTIQKNDNIFSESPVFGPPSPFSN